jgi:hypothetical protein
MFWSGSQYDAMTMEKWMVAGPRRVAFGSAVAALKRMNRGVVRAQTENVSRNITPAFVRITLAT